MRSNLFRNNYATHRDTVLMLLALLVVALLGFSWKQLIKDETIEIKAQEIQYPQDQIGAGAILDTDGNVIGGLGDGPIATPEPMCATVTPFDSEIEQVWHEDACDAKRMLRWTDSMGNVYGENTMFQIVADSLQRNGSVDRGLFRVNSGTFDHYMRVRPELLNARGITSWEDMKTPLLNIRMAKIIYDVQGACAWFASPPSLCSKNYPNVTE